MIGYLTSKTAANHTKFEVTNAIGSCGPVFAKAIPTIVSVTLKDQSSWQNRKAAATALGRLGQQLPPTPPMKEEDGPGPDAHAVRGLISALRTDTSHLVRREAINSLILLGPPKVEAVWKELRTALTEAKRDNDKSVALWARVAYLRIDQEPMPKTTDPDLIAITKSLYAAEVVDKEEAIQALGVLGDQAGSRVPELIAMVRSNELNGKDVKVKNVKGKNNKAHNEEPGTIAMALWALSQIPSKMNDTLPTISEYKSASDPIIKGAADTAYKALTAKPDPNAKKDPPPKP
jgi:hypothetical protein